jgi:2-oxoglutarate ferredoxin oxidoreductase subunit delta
MVDEKIKHSSVGKETPSGQVEIYGDWCKKCGICAAFCPKGVLRQEKNGTIRAQRPDLCDGCRLCELRCPDFAIQIHTPDKSKKNGPISQNT